MFRNLAVQEAGPEDLAEIEALVKLAYAEFRDFFPETAWFAWMENIGKVIHAETGLILVVLESGKIVGVVKFYPDAAASNMGYWPAGVAAIRILAVHPEYRGRGLGRRLVQTCLDQARFLHIPALYLYTGVFMDAARRLYESLGFQRAPEYDRDPGPIAYHINLAS
jgi:ribosomal protein S18 acetylase RimI-like enzyme